MEIYGLLYIYEYSIWILVIYMDTGNWSESPQRKLKRKFALFIKYSMKRVTFKK